MGLHGFLLSNLSKVIHLFTRTRDQSDTNTDFGYPNCFIWCAFILMFIFNLFSGTFNRKTHSMFSRQTMNIICKFTFKQFVHRGLINVTKRLICNGRTPLCLWHVSINLFYKLNSAHYQFLQPIKHWSTSRNCYSLG